MKQTAVERVAAAIGNAQLRGWNSKWTLARVAVLAMAETLPVHVKQAVLGEMEEKSMRRLKAYRDGARKAAATRRRAALRAAAREEAEGDNIGVEAA